jgi:hypothetical protein
MQNNVNNGKSHEKYWRLRQEPKPNGVLAVVLVLTILVNFCPLYLPFGLSTCKRNRESK